MAQLSPDLIVRTIKLIREQGIISAGDHVLVGCSGGIDSTALLFVLNELKERIGFYPGVAHINHLLRGSESERDQAFVENAAARYGLPFFLKRADVKGYAGLHGLSIQHAARDIRYQFLNEVADHERFTRIATAHNLDDQIETFLLRLVKGSGLRGLSSIPPARDRIIRPFLNVYRSEIISFARSHSIRFVEDSSNAKTVYERNYIRHRIMPLIDELNPAFREKIVSLLHDINGVNAIFDQKKKEFMRFVRHERPDIVIPLETFTELDEEVRYRVMADVFAQLAPSFIPLREHVHLVEKMIRSHRPNLRVDLPSGLKAKKIYDSLVFTTRPLSRPIRETFDVREGMNHFPPLNIDIEIEILKSAPLTYPEDPCTAYFDSDKCGDLIVRTFRPGDRMHPLGMTNPVKVKDFFISRKIPLEDRGHIPLLLSGNEIIWIVGHRIDERYKLTGNTRTVLKATVKSSCQPSPE